jgi:hypothetical protein
VYAGGMLHVYMTHAHAYCTFGISLAALLCLEDCEYFILLVLHCDLLWY